MKNIEVELKFQIIGNIEDFLKTLTFVKEKRIVDIYLDTKDGDLYKKGIFIRIRDNKKLDFKYNMDDSDNLHEHCEEHSFILPLKENSLSAINENCSILKLNQITEPDLEKFKILNRLIDSMIIDKIRKTFKDSEFEYSLDNVRGLGNFIN